MTKYGAHYAAIAQRMVNAKLALIDTLAACGDLSKAEATKVADAYIAGKLVKADFVIGRYSVKHGALLDRDAINTVLGNLNKMEKQ